MASRNSKTGKIPTKAAAFERKIWEQEVAEKLIKVKTNNVSLQRFLSFIRVEAGLISEWHIIAQKWRRVNIALYFE